MEGLAVGNTERLAGNVEYQCDAVSVVKGDAVVDILL